MECREARQILLEYHEGQLDLEGQMRIEAHLLTCSGCREELRAVRSLVAAIVDLPVPDPSPGFALRLSAQLREERQTRSPSELRHFRLRHAWVAASVAFVLVAGAAWWALISVSTGPSPTANSGATTNLDKPTGGSAAGDHADARSAGSRTTEAENRQLVSRAPDADKLNIDEVALLWAAALPTRKAMEAFVELTNLSDQELAELLMRLLKA